MKKLTSIGGLSVEMGSLTRSKALDLLLTLERRRWHQFQRFSIKYSQLRVCSNIFFLNVSALLHSTLALDVARNV